MRSSVVKRLYQAKRAGHAGTLDPLASGLLPIALGEATKTVPFVMDGRKTYRFTVRWGEERDTDDSEGRATANSDARPTPDAIRALLPRFTGTIEQVPPRYSAIKIDGERAYDLAREGKIVELASRPVDIHRLDIVETPDADHTVLAAECGKGTYVRAIARDMGRALGCYGHVSALRRTGVGQFQEADSAQLADLQAAAPAEERRPDGAHRAAAAGRRRFALDPLARRQPRRRRPARTRPAGAAARPRRPDHAGVRRGIHPRRPDRAGRIRAGRTAAAAHLQSRRQRLNPGRKEILLVFSMLNASRRALRP